MHFRTGKLFTFKQLPPNKKFAKMIQIIQTHARTHNLIILLGKSQIDVTK